VFGTNDSDVINVAEGPQSGSDITQGAETFLVSINGFETFEAGNKFELIALGLAGNDRIDLNNLVLPGLDGGARLIGGDGDDHLIGSAADDDLFGNRGDDRLEGEDGNDRLEGGEGDDTLEGGLGDDALVPGPGNNVVDGGGGDDALTLELTDAPEVVTISHDQIVIETPVDGHTVIESIVPTNIDVLNIATRGGEDEVYIHVDSDLFYEVVNVCTGDEEDLVDATFENPAFPTTLNLDGGDPTLADITDTDGGEGAETDDRIGDHLIVRLEGGDDQVDSITEEKIVIGGAQVNHVNFEFKEVLEGRLVDAVSRTRTVAPSRFRFEDKDGDTASVFFRGRGVGTVYRDIMNDTMDGIDRAADIHTIDITGGDPRKTKLMVQVKAPREGGTDGKTSIGSIVGSGHSIMARSSDLVGTIPGVDPDERKGLNLSGQSRHVRLGDIADNLSLNFGGALTGSPMFFFVGAVGKNVSLTSGGVLSNARFNGWGDGGNIAFKRINRMRSDGDFLADVETLRQDFYDRGSRIIQVFDGNVQSNITTDKLTLLQIMSRDRVLRTAEVNVNIISDATSLLGQPGITKFMTKGVNLMNSTVNMKPGVVMSQFQVLPGAGRVGGDLIGTNTINGDLMTAKIGAPGALFDINGTLQKTLTLKCADTDDAVNILDGTDAVVQLDAHGPKARVICRPL